MTKCQDLIDSVGSRETRKELFEHRRSMVPVFPRADYRIMILALLEAGDGHLTREELRDQWHFASNRAIDSAWRALERRGLTTTPPRPRVGPQLSESAMNIRGWALALTGWPWRFLRFWSEERVLQELKIAACYAEEQGLLDNVLGVYTQYEQL